MKFQLPRCWPWLLGVLHACIVAASLGLAWMIRYDFSIPQANLRLLAVGLAWALPVKLGVFVLARSNRSIWRFADTGDLPRLFVVNLLASGAFIVVMLVAAGKSMPLSICLIDFLLCFLLTEILRLAPDIYSETVMIGRARNSKGILIYGAGVAGTMLAREIRKNPSLGYRVVGFVDDDLSKRDAMLMGVPVLGTGRDAARIVERSRASSRSIEQIVIAIPSANARQIRDVLDDCRSAGVACKMIPSHGELLSGKVRDPKSHALSVEDLLGRDPVQLNEQHVRAHVMGRTILVTGAAGSIGSELCRQIAGLEPCKLIAFDQAESELFKIDLDLRKNFPSLDLMAEVGDIRDYNRIGELIARESVTSVFHAAAYKHVPLMEMHVFEAVKNNILGTWNVVQAAYENRVEDFLMISTDKAVRPVSVMGATKRVAELIVSAMPTSSAGRSTRFVSVRFGNVLGSNGSVVPLFQAQIVAGGPVTVTHPEVRRYFMTIREAVQLILQASAMGKRSEIYVLDMGEPVRIADLARRMVQLSGFVPDRDIEIRYTGLRPGEKIYEELITQGENILPTYHDKIKIFQGQPLEIGTIEAWIEGLKVLVGKGDEQAALEHIKELVPEYRQLDHQLRQALVAGSPDDAMAVYGATGLVQKM
jgi:FlaA1/EpsC-like NDP-sugar epimerase